MSNPQWTPPGAGSARSPPTSTRRRPPRGPASPPIPPPASTPMVRLSMASPLFLPASARNVPFLLSCGAAAPRIGICQGNPRPPSPKWCRGRSPSCRRCCAGRFRFRIWGRHEPAHLSPRLLLLSQTVSEWISVIVESGLKVNCCSRSELREGRCPFVRRNICSSVYLLVQWFPRLAVEGRCPHHIDLITIE
jgi:hypothetical protein